MPDPTTARRSSFHNTIGLAPAEKEAAEHKAGSQELIILSFYNDHRTRMFTPSEIHKALFKPETPLTSIRRAITNLTKAGHLRKTDVKTLGPYGMPEHAWYAPQPVKKHEQQKLF